MWRFTNLTEETSMRKLVALALTASLLAVPAALGEKGQGHEGDFGAPKAAKIEKKVKMATFEFSGTVAALGDGTITVTPVRAHGKRSRVALGDAVTFTAKFDAATRITRSGMGRVTIDQVMAGDRVKVEIRAPRGTALVDLPAAKRIKVKAAKVMEPVADTSPETEVEHAPEAPEATPVTAPVL